MSTNTRAEALDALYAMNRPSTNGHEVTLTPSAGGPRGGDWFWSVIRYPLDPSDTTPTDILEDFFGRNTFEQAVAWLDDYLPKHPEDGFYFN